MRYEAYTHYLIYETRVINEAQKKKENSEYRQCDLAYQTRIHCMNHIY